MRSAGRLDFTVIGMIGEAGTLFESTSAENPPATFPFRKGRLSGCGADCQAIDYARAPRSGEKARCFCSAKRRTWHTASVFDVRYYVGCWGVKRTCCKRDQSVAGDPTQTSAVALTTCREAMPLSWTAMVSQLRLPGIE